MCGITGWVAFERDLTAERGVLDAMTATQVRRARTPAASTWSRTPRSATAGSR